MSACVHVVCLRHGIRCLTRKNSRVFGINRTLSDYRKDPTRDFELSDGESSPAQPLKIKLNPKETPEMLLYRQQLSKLRKIYRQEWLTKVQQETSTSRVLLSEEEQKERMMEEQALEANKLENKRMIKRSEEKQAKREKHLMMKRSAKTLVREATEKELEKRRNAIVIEVLQQSKNFITFDNLDAKIQEAVEREVNFNFAIELSGEKVYTNTSYVL